MTDRPGDPADKATDAKADGAFGGVTNHRAGYGDDKLQRIVDYLGRHPRATLASGEGLVLVAHIGLLRADLTDARAEIDRLTRILAALRKPSVAMVEAVCAAMLRMDTKTKDIIRAAVAAAEQEVGGE